MIPIFKYLCFLFKSTNQHGVHSPFIYSYLTKCLYVKPRMHPKTAIDVVLKSIPYLGLTNLYLPENEFTLRAVLDQNFGSTLNLDPPYDLIYLPEPDPAILTKTGSHKVFHNDSLCVIDEIHSTPGATERWEEVKSLDQARITIDGFFCGLVFFRKEQARQHFTIRI